MSYFLSATSKPRRSVLPPWLTTSSRRPGFVSEWDADDGDPVLARPAAPWRARHRASRPAVASGRRVDRQLTTRPARPRARKQRGQAAPLQLSPHLGRDHDAGAFEPLEVGGQGGAVDARLARERIVHREHALLQDPFERGVGGADRDLAALEGDGEAARRGAAPARGERPSTRRAGAARAVRNRAGGRARSRWWFMTSIANAGDVMTALMRSASFASRSPSCRLRACVRQVRAELAFLRQRGLEQLEHREAGRRRDAERHVQRASAPVSASWYWPRGR